MTNALSRRGFTQIALLGATGLWLPKLAAAQSLPRLVARFESRSDASRLGVALFLHNRESERVVLTANAIHLVAEVPGKSEPITLAQVIEHERRDFRSRAGPRIRRFVTLQPQREERYADFRTAWPQDVDRGGLLRVRLHAALRISRGSQAESLHPGLSSLRRIRGHVIIGG